MGKRIVKNKAQYRAAIQGLTQEMNARLAELKIEEAEAFYAFCVSVLQHAVERAPVEWGDLRGTAYLEINGSVAAIGNDKGPPSVLSDPVLPGDIIQARVVFPMKYALVQHEHPEFAHPKGGQAYYLEAGFQEAVREYAARLRGG